jgi:hypothetical protein
MFTSIQLFVVRCVYNVINTNRLPEWLVGRAQMVLFYRLAQLTHKQLTTHVS